MPNDEPYWSEELQHPTASIWQALLAIAVRRGSDTYQAIGTAFVIGPTQRGASAMSAAHVFEEIYRIQNPKKNKPINPIFGPDPQIVDLSPEQVFALAFDANRVHFLKITNLLYDLKSDIAFFCVEKITPDNRALFRYGIELDSELPPKGTEVEGLGFKKMLFSRGGRDGYLNDAFGASLTSRVGVVTEVLVRTTLFSGPGVRVSFPIFGGMSGGPVMRLTSDSRVVAFGLLSSDYDDSDDVKHDVYTVGTTTVAKLPITFRIENGERVMDFNFLSPTENIGKGKN